jgi:ubiquinone/menaquinone biosynthesis C-methylase UbiE
MTYNWIDAKDYDMNCFLFFERWILSFIFKGEDNFEYVHDMAKALYKYPYVKEFIRIKAPECSGFLDAVERVDCSKYTSEELQEAETKVLQMHETFVVYAYPEVMNRVNYIRNWSPENLYRLVDLDDKTVLDVGAGTGRLAFAAAKRARMVYASEPCDRLREFMRDKIKKEGIANVRVLDGFIECLPFEDDTFDVAMCGHVIGDDYDKEIAELTRVLKDGGFIVACNGDDEFKRQAPDAELVKRGFEWFRHESIEGGIIYDYRKQVGKPVKSR